MSDVQDKKQKAVSGQEDEIPIPVGQYTISKILGIQADDISSEYKFEKVYSDLFEELKDKEFDAYQKKYKSTNRNIDFANRFREILGHEDKSVLGIFNDIVGCVNDMIAKSDFIKDDEFDAALKGLKGDDSKQEELKKWNSKLKELKELIYPLTIWKELKSQLSANSQRSWVTQNKRPSNEEGRLALYKISFAFNLNMEDHRKLFTYVFKLKPYLRTPAEFCLTYAKEHNMEYSEAVNLYYKYLKERDGNHIKESDDHHDSKTKGSEKYSGTKTLLKKVSDSESDNDHEKFICKLLSVSGTLNVTRKTIEQKIFDIAIAENGKKTVCDDDLMRYGLDSLKALMSKFYNGMYDTGNREAKSKNSKENKSEKNKNKGSQRKPNPQAEFLISIESAFKDKDNKMPVGSKAILQLRKIYIICRTYQMWNSFDKEDEYKNIFTGFYNTLSRDLIKINLPQLDYLDDFDRGIILATAYRLHKNLKETLVDETLVDLINKIVPSE